MYETKSGNNSQEFREMLLSASREIGTRWPGIQYNAERAMQVISEYGRSTEHGASIMGVDWPIFLANVFESSEPLEDVYRVAAQPIAGAALEQIAGKRQDSAMRKRLTNSAVQDERAAIRSSALRALSGHWPDEMRRGAACSALGKMHSEFGRILPTRDLDDIPPYLDPLEPIPREHIERAAKRAGIRPDDIDAAVASLSAHLGWDITRGAKPSGPASKAKRKRRRR